MQEELEASIQYFLDCTCRLTPRWFNKPKFHILVHLPEHIKRFGPPMLFATEGFESFNAIIRAHSVHSNRHAPSRDIAKSMAQCNRTRHLLSGGFFKQPTLIEFNDQDDPNGQESISSIAQSGRSPWMQTHGPSDTATWTTIGAQPRHLLQVNGFGPRILGFAEEEDSEHPVVPGEISISGSKSIELIVSAHVGTIYHAGKPIAWHNTQTAAQGIAIPPDVSGTRVNAIRTPERVTASNGDWCSLQSWVLFNVDNDNGGGSERPNIGIVQEILQATGTVAELRGQANWILIRRARSGEPHELYNMPQLTLLEEYTLVRPQVSTFLTHHGSMSYGPLRLSWCRASEGM